jgi:hypothetical protein
MNLPRRAVRPILTILPSWTAMTGEPALAKTLIPRRVLDEATGRAAFWPFFILFLAMAVSLMSSA